jgi:predicted PurR-regulated permease PerM
MTRQHLFAAFFFAVFLFLLFQFYLMFSVFIAPLTWAALLAFIFYPLNTRLTRWMYGRPSLASFLLTTTVILAVMVPTIFLIILLANESAALYQRSTEFLNGPGLHDAIERLRASTPARAWTLWTRILQGWNIDLADMAMKGTNVVSGFLVSQAAGILKNIASFVLDFFLTTFALFFFFRDGARMVGGFRDLLPMEPTHKDMVLERLHETLSAVVQGTLITAAAQGALAGLGFAALGVPFAVFLGCASAFASLLPFGAPVVWTAVAIYLGFTGSIAKTVLLILWGTLVVGTIDNFIRPILIGGRTEIPTILLFFGILGGLQAYGFLGVFLAPVVIAILVAFVRIYREQYA